ncbi:MULTISPECIES: TVP38/TMEM64 family protein [Halomonadaceae]|uniref:TVP38/TMEM64 family protein n=1 Tax=Halomonadaceae TaxID=28256 RepID=UPI00159AF06F|nr:MULTISPECIES: VTT domain-containing protein [Halomonas]QJQ95935.1 TVP38/TMEM64 family protein [Halomonas sp. PA5]
MPKKLVLIGALLIILIALGVLWQWLAMQDVLTVRNLMDAVRRSASWRDSPWSIFLVIGIYTAGSLVMFPLSILVALTGLLFGPLWGFGYALAGAMVAAAATYWVGRRLGRDALLHYGGERLNGLSRYLAGRGIRTMTLVSLVPMAPFTLTNMLAGAFHIRFRDYMLGSLIGNVPGLATLTILGNQLGSLLTADNRQEMLWAALGVAAGLGVLYGLKRYYTRKAETARKAKQRQP